MGMIYNIRAVFRPKNGTDGAEPCSDIVGAKNIAYQLAKSGTSEGANYEESQASQSKEDFYYKIGICLREARESNYWLRII